MQFEIVAGTDDVMLPDELGSELARCESDEPEPEPEPFGLSPPPNIVPDRSIKASDKHTLSRVALLDLD